VEVETGTLSHHDWLCPRRETPGLGIGQISRDERTARALIDDPSFGYELFEGRYDREALDAKRMRECSRAGQGVARPQSSAFDVARNRAHNLLEQRHAAATLDRERDLPMRHAPLYITSPTLD
jgi:hypothetical protein